MNNVNFENLRKLIEEKTNCSSSPEKKYRVNREAIRNILTPEMFIEEPKNL